MTVSTEKLKLGSDIRHTRVGDEAVVLCQDKVEVLVVNDVAARFLELVDGNRTLADVLSQLEDEYDVDRPTLQQDISAYVDELLANGVVEAA